MRIFVLITAALLAACTAPRAPDSEPPRTAPSVVPTLLVSFDGFRAEYLERGLTPTFERFGRRGVRARWMTPAYPSLTFPNHYTIVTGLDPDRHGIVHNTMRDAAIPGTFAMRAVEQHADPRWWGGEPIWSTARRHGLRTATMFWVGSEAPIAGHHPDDWLHYDVDFAYEDRVARVLEWLARPPATRPAFATLYLETLDKAGHAHGPDSPEVAAALSRADALLASLLAGLDRLALEANVVIVSDHGMAAISPERVIFLDDLVPEEVAEPVTRGEVVTFAPRAGREHEAEAALLTPHEHMDCWRKGELPARFRYGTHPRIPAIVCQAEVGWVAGTREELARRLPNFPRGAHGFDNAAKEMRAIFLADGPAFRDGVVLESIEARDVYNVLAGALGIPPAPNDGVPAVARSVLANSP